MDEPLASAVAHWKAWFGRRDELRKRLVPEVTRWEWSIGPRYSLLPLFFQRYPGRGRLLKAVPARKAQHRETGLDNRGRPIVQRVYDYRERASETFFLHGDVETRIVEFGPKPYLPLESTRVLTDGGRVTRHELFRLNGYTDKYPKFAKPPERLIEWLGPYGRFLLTEDYHYEGDQLTAIEMYGESPGVGPYRVTDHITYGPDGTLAGIDRVWADGTVQVVYRPRGRGLTLDELRSAAVAELVPAVVHAIRTAAPGERLYCVSLLYQEVAQYFPPLIVLGLERERARISDPSLVFYPLLSGGISLELPNPDRLTSCRQLDQEVRSSQNWELGKELLRSAAIELTRHDWTGALDVTDDFVAFAADPELSDLEQELTFAASAVRIAEWKARGWI
jgi:hypothetical protein